MAKEAEHVVPLVHHLRPGGSGETVEVGAVDTAKPEGKSGRRVLRWVTLFVALCLSFATAYARPPWPLALALVAWVAFGALALGKESQG